MIPLLKSIRHIGICVVRWILSILIPIKNDKILFQSIPDYSDNCRAFSDFLIENTTYHIYWSVKEACNYQSNDRITFIETDGGRYLIDKIRFIYHTVSAKFLFSTHEAFLFANTHRQKYICLWHGTPLKKIAVLQNPNNKNYLSNASFILCSSKYYVPIMARCFGRREDIILPLGYPRNDWLFEESSILSDLGISVGKDEKLVTYLPTFRRTSAESEGDSKKDVFSSGLFDFYDKSNLMKLNDYLKKIGVVLVVKPHPADVNQLEYNVLSNVAILPQSYLSEKDLQLYHLLHYSDALLTDFSSVYADYLNLDRPIGFLLSDISDYSSNRGFIFDNPLDYLPGVKLFNEADLIAFLEDVSNNVDVTKHERDNQSYIYNDYRAGNSKRLFDYLGL